MYTFMHQTSVVIVPDIVDTILQQLSPQGLNLLKLRWRSLGAVIDLYQGIGNENSFIYICILHLSCGKVILNQQQDVGQSFAGALLRIRISFHQIKDLLVLQVFKPQRLAIAPRYSMVILDKLLNSGVRDPPHLLILQALIWLSWLELSQ